MINVSAAYFPPAYYGSPIPWVEGIEAVVGRGPRADVIPRMDLREPEQLTLPSCLAEPYGWPPFSDQGPPGFRYRFEKPSHISLRYGDWFPTQMALCLKKSGGAFWMERTH